MDETNQNFNDSAIINPLSSHGNHFTSDFEGSQILASVGE